jgi:hypothetical protein
MGAQERRTGQYYGPDAQCQFNVIGQKYASGAVEL